jgi:hypothetical protein
MKDTKDAIQLDLFTGLEVPARFRCETDRYNTRWFCVRCARVYYQNLEPTVCACMKRVKK